jgi:BMFP domain-containing protein YqiC
VAPDNPLIQGALNQMMSIFEKRIQERDAELEDHWTKMLEATAERDSVKMDLVTERALWTDEKKVLQQKIGQLEAQLKERDSTIEGMLRGFSYLLSVRLSRTNREQLFLFGNGTGATPGTKRPRPESMVAGTRTPKQARTEAMTST